MIIDTMIIDTVVPKVGALGRGCRNTFITDNKNDESDDKKKITTNDDDDDADDSDSEYDDENYYDGINAKYNNNHTIKTPDILHT